MKNRKQVLIGMAMLFACAAISIIPLTGCKSTLQTGGSYAPTNSVGQATAMPDLAFYQVDAAFDLAYSTVDATFKFEQDNRAMLWALSPKIKGTLDGIRPDAAQAVQAYGVARSAYLANPTPASLTTLQSWLAKAQQLAVTAGAVVNNLPKGN